MIEYIFFDPAVSDRFAASARELGVECSQRGDNMGYIVSLPEDLDETIEAGLEACYDELQAEQASLFDAAEEGQHRHLAGFRLELPDGQYGMVPLDPDLARRLMAEFTLDEIQDLFATVAKHALNPQDVPVCQVVEPD